MTPRPRRPHARPRRSHPHRRPELSGSVWAVAQRSAHPDARLIEPRWIEMINRTVFICIRARHCLPILASPNADSAGPGPRTSGGPLPVPTEAVGSASRLLRTIEVLSDPLETANRSAEDALLFLAQSVPGSPSESVDGPWTDSRRPKPGRGPTAGGVDRYDGAIVPVGSRHSDWLLDVRWETLLAPRGDLVVTHSDNQQGWLANPSGLAPGAVWNARQLLSVRVALLKIPRCGGTVTREPGRLSELPSVGAPPAPVPRHARASASVNTAKLAGDPTPVFVVEDKGRSSRSADAPGDTDSRYFDSGLPASIPNATRLPGSLCDTSPWGDVASFGTAPSLWLLAADGWLSRCGVLR